MGAENDRYGAFDIKLAPGKYEVTVVAEGFQPHKDAVNLLGKEHQPFLRVVLKPSLPASSR